MSEPPGQQESDKTRPALSGRRRHVAINAFAASFQLAVQMGTAIVLYAYLLRVLGAEQVGVWLALLAVGLLACVADLGLRDAMVRVVAAGMVSHERQHVRVQAETLLITLATSMALALGIVLLILPWAISFTSIDESQRADALALAPYMVAVVWLQRVGDTYSACLEGMQHYVLTAANNTLGYVVGLATAFLLVPNSGLYGVAYAMTAQGAVILLGNMVLQYYLQAPISLLPHRWSLPVLRQSLRYGLSVQVLVISVQILEILPKLLFATFGFLAYVSYFDLAFRIGKGVRSLLAAGSRVLVPIIAQSSVRQTDDSEELYRFSFSVLMLLAVMVFFPIISFVGVLAVWLAGEWNLTFVVTLAIVLPAWLIFTLVDPLLNIGLGTGRLRPAVQGHLLMLLISAPLGWLLSELYGGEGVSIAVSLSIVLGCVLTLWLYHSQDKLPWSVIDPPRTARLLLLGGLGAGLAIAATVRLQSELSIWVWGVLALVLGVLPLAVGLWFHPLLRKIVQRLIAMRLKKGTDTNELRRAD